MTPTGQLVFFPISYEDVNLKFSVATFPPHQQWQKGGLSRNKQSLEKVREEPGCVVVLGTSPEAQVVAVSVFFQALRPRWLRSVCFSFLDSYPHPSQLQKPSPPPLFLCFSYFDVFFHHLKMSRFCLTHRDQLHR